MSCSGPCNQLFQKKFFECFYNYLELSKKVSFIFLSQILTDLEICHIAFLYIFFSNICIGQSRRALTCIFLDLVRRKMCYSASEADIGTLLGKLGIWPSYLQCFRVRRYQCSSEFQQVYMSLLQIFCSSYQFSFELNFDHCNHNQKMDDFF